jgi:hypothetical protein
MHSLCFIYHGILSGANFCVTFGSPLVGDIDLSKQVNSWSIRGILVNSRFLNIVNQGDAVPCLLLLAKNMADLHDAFINALAAPIGTAVTVTVTRVCRTQSDALNALVVPIQSILREIREVRGRVKNWTSRLPRSSYLTRRGSARVQSFVQLSFVCSKWLVTKLVLELFIRRRAANRNRSLFETAKL